MMYSKALQTTPWKDSLNSSIEIITNFYGVRIFRNFSVITEFHHPTQRK